MVEILACPACGGQVPLSDADVVPCPFCKAPVELPPAHRALRDAERKEASARTEAAALFARYGKKPSVALRILAVMFNPWFLLLDGFFLLLLLAMLGVILVGQLLSPLLHANIWDTLPDAPKGYGMFAIAAGSMLAGITLGIYGRRKLLGLRTLQAALAAKPPTRPGESAMCRECGAPLHVPDGAEGVRCAYCHADNLVDIPPDWIAGFDTSRVRVGRAIEETVGWLAEEHRRIRRSFVLQLSIAGSVLVGFITLIAISANPDPGWRAGWSLRVQAPRTLVRLRNRADKKQVPIGGCERIDTLPDECAGGICRVWLYAALREGEHFTLRGATSVRATLHSHFWWGKDHEEGFGREVGGETFTAPWSAWYQLRVDFPENAPELCASL